MTPAETEINSLQCVIIGLSPDDKYPAQLNIRQLREQSVEKIVVEIDFQPFVSTCTV